MYQLTCTMEEPNIRNYRASMTCVCMAGGLLGPPGNGCFVLSRIGTASLYRSVMWWWAGKYRRCDNYSYRLQWPGD